MDHGVGVQHHKAYAGLAQGAQEEGWLHLLFSDPLRWLALIKLFFLGYFQASLANTSQ